MEGRTREKQSGDSFRQVRDTAGWKGGAEREDGARSGWSLDLC